jgi:hypothetical protein
MTEMSDISDRVPSPKRDSLARNIALRNPSLSTRELNFAVQRTIDRLIFLRICEDRGIEHYAFLQSLMNGERAYPRLVRDSVRTRHAVRMWERH